jgi:hypothetical protein
VDRYANNRIRYYNNNEPRPPKDGDGPPKDGPTWSREHEWLRSKLSPQALEASTWYASWVKHRNQWLGYDEWKLPGNDLTVSRDVTSLGGQL